MKTSNYIFFCMFFLFFFSCTQSGGEKKSMPGKRKANIDQKNGQKEQLGESGSEDFELFIENFSNHESFQLERIKFPIKVVIPDNAHEGMAPIEETIGRYDWEILDLTYDSTYLTRPYDQYYQGIRYGNDTAVVEIRGINNGIYADYYFTLIDDKWYLVTLYEASF